ncbi:MAG TPA: hypothetical protein VMD30_02705 [Tepidisphaeraceae bacterium]|nr:hypothetical protein [Tepidisphaeraceae bacterium]
MKKLTVDLPRPMTASNDCLPHAAMNLGSARGMGMRPVASAVTRLVIDEQMGNFVLYRLDESGGFVGDSWHGSLDDALWQIKKEFGVESAGLAPRGAAEAADG